MNPETLIPVQREGVAKEIHHLTEAGSKKAAQQIFKRAKERLLQPSAWSAATKGISSSFILYAADGETALSRPAQSGDLVRIELPGFHPAYDWVRLEAVMEGTDDEGASWITLSTRPIPDPKATDEGTAHFFSKNATGTFIIRLAGSSVEGNHYGRNELPNTDGGNILDKARAVLVTAGAYLGLSDVQWSNLLKGLISAEAPNL